MKRSVIVLLFFPFYLFSQNKKATNPGWRMITSAGLVAGETNTKSVFQLSGGLVYDRHFVGIGVGYDSYQFNSFPVFADWRMSFGKKEIGFLYANGGYNLSGNHKEENEWAKTNDQLKGGLYVDAGIGYRLRLGTFNRLSFSAGYSRKNNRHIKTFLYRCSTGDCPEDIREYRYNFGRMIAKFSWELSH